MGPSLPQGEVIAEFILYGLKHKQAVREKLGPARPQALKVWRSSQRHTCSEKADWRPKEPCQGCYADAS